MENKTVILFDFDKSAKESISIIAEQYKNVTTFDNTVNTINGKSNREKWIRMSLFVSKLLVGKSSRDHASIISKLEKETGYKKTQLYKFANAGEKLLCWESEKPLPATFNEFLKNESKPKNTIIKNLRVIGCYEAYYRKFTIYSGNIEKDRALKTIFFKTTDELTSTTVEIVIKQEANANGKIEDKAYYSCNGEAVQLYDFEPRMCGSLDIKADK